AAAEPHRDTMLAPSTTRRSEVRMTRSLAILVSPSRCRGTAMPCPSYSTVVGRSTLAVLAMLTALIVPVSTITQEAHQQHPASGVREEVLGKVSFPVSCDAAVQDGFNRGVALLHSFAMRQRRRLLAT